MIEKNINNILFNSIKPDIIMNYNPDMDNSYPLAVIYVRPETNALPYEKAIIKGITPFADVVYIANLNGKIFIKDALILEHYACQYRFAIYAKEEIKKYPEMVKEFEDYFKVKFEEADIIGAFDAILKLQISKKDLFFTFVESQEFLKFYGQTIKKINNTFVVNYDIPALLYNYDENVNIFVILIRFKNTCSSYSEVNQSIANEIIKNKNTYIIEENILKETFWEKKIKRAYHFSNNHIMTMFDMADFVVTDTGSHLTLDETPLGKFLIENKILSNDNLYKLKEYPIVYINDCNKKKLVNINEEGNNKSFDETIELIKNIILE